MRVLFGLASAFATLSVGCESGPSINCQADGSCGCSSQSGECFLACYADGCRLGCNDMELACGSICFDRCQAECTHTKRCSHSCGNACNLRCDNTEECSGICGADCQYTCDHTQVCGVRVGPGSRVNCSDMDNCYVECEGSCEVSCQRVQNQGCHITCLSGPDKGAAKQYDPSDTPYGCR